MRQTQAARIENPDTDINRANIHTEINNNLIEEKIFIIWLTVLEFMVFTFANFIPSVRVSFVVLGLAIQVYREFDPF
jgi:hypothetical protein